MDNYAAVTKKWEAVLDHPEMPKIEGAWKRKVTAVVMEQTVAAIDSERSAMGGMLNEAAPTNSTGSSIQNYDPILISLVRRALPKLIAYDVMGVQPLTGPTGLIFAMRSKYGNQGAESFFNEANSAWSGANTSNQAGTDPVANTDVNYTGFTYGTAMPTANAEALGSTNAQAFAEMSFSIEKVTATAQSRAMKAEYSMELAQDLKAIHGLDAESELSNILSTELIAEINREAIRTIYNVAVPGAQVGTTTPGMFDLDTDSNGRWSVEKFKGLVFQLERDANAVAKGTRRGKGNTLIVSSDVASALAMTGVLSYTPQLQVSLEVDDTGNTFAGTMHGGKTKVYIDPYYSSSTGLELALVGYKGPSQYDAGLFYCPYVPLQMVRAIDPNTFQPKIGFKTRYAMVANPFAEGLTVGSGALNKRRNQYYRIFAVNHLM